MPQDLTSFSIKWQQTQLTERSAYQQHFRDLCEALGVPHPTEEDLVGNNYTFEKHVTKVSEGKGFADVWKRDAFAFEYKLPGGDLKKAYKQLIDYHEDLDNPPLLVVTDFKRFEVHTKFDSQRSRVYAFDLEELRLNKPVPTSAVLPQDVLRYVFGDRNMLRPEAVTERVTRDAATDLLKLAQQLERERAAAPTPHTKEEIAHFLIRIVFCLFADSIGLIPNNVFRKLVEASRQSRIMFNKQLPQLFEAMSNEDRYFGSEFIPYFNGGLFNGTETIELNTADCDILRKAARNDWSQIEPSIFGTLFERSLDAAKRAMIGAHYTSPEDILLLIEPVVMTPLRRDWAITQTAIEEALAAEEGQTQNRNLRANRPAAKLLTAWAERLSKVRILDPACGSGNFLYIAMKQLLDLWEEARAFGLKRGLLLPVESMPTPAQLYGIELDFYAHEIASAVVWIGLLQWKRDHSYNDQPKPILHKLSNIEHADAIMRYDAEANTYEPEWPPAEYIVGNPPFLGSRRLRTELGDAYVDDLYKLYKGRVPQEADLVIYWFSKSERYVSVGGSRVGLIGTQAIRAGSNRAVLKRILDHGSIFAAWANRPWILAGAAVRISMVAFDNGSENEKWLDGSPVANINADLTSGNDLTLAKPLTENKGLSYQGPVKVGPFEIEHEVARKMLSAPLNPNGRPNSDVVIPWIVARDLTDRPHSMYIIDFQAMTKAEASLYEAPFQYVKHHVKPTRSENKRARRRETWWQHGERNLGMRKAIAGLKAYIASPRVSKHRIFSRVPVETLADSRVVVIARSDDYFFGLLESSIHTLWSLASSSRHGVGNDITYNIESCFDTFPFPYPPGTEPTEADSPIVLAIADAARDLVRLRDAWLNPPGASGDDLKTRTLTKLYNARPEWLANAHRTLDEAVFAAYGWPSTLTDQETLARLLALNHQRAGQ
jgi:type II restriction/modification system DNA methylase subunit YeeA